MNNVRFVGLDVHTESIAVAVAELHARYVRLMGRGKSKQETVAAVGRELLGFIWATGVEIEQRSSTPVRRAA